MKNKKTIIAIMAFIVMLELTVIYIFLSVIVENSNITNIQKNGIHTTATVVELQEKTSSRHHEGVYFLVYEFYDNADTPVKHIGKTRQYYSPEEAITISEIEIIYDAKTFKSFEADYVLPNSTTTMIYFLAGATIILGAAYVIIYRYSKRKNKTDNITELNELSKQ